MWLEQLINNSQVSKESYKMTSLIISFNSNTKSANIRISPLSFFR